MSRADREFHRKTAVACFNRTWDFLEKKRNAANDMEMLQLVHTSRYHWRLLGTPSNHAISDWQVSRVYVSLGQPSLALLFAESSLDICRKNGLSDILCTAFEGVARAYAAAGDGKKARSYLGKAKAWLRVSTLDDEDRALYENQIRDTESMLSRR